MFALGCFVTALIALFNSVVLHLFDIRMSICFVWLLCLLCLLLIVRLLCGLWYCLVF